MGQNTPCKEKGLLPFIRIVDVIKGSPEEISFLSGTNNILRALQKVSSMGPRLVCATDGVNGSLIFYKEKIHRIPAYRLKEEDTTGAGEVYLASFLFFHGVMNENIQESALLSSASASFSMEGKGTSRLADIKGIRRRSSILKSML